MNIVLILSEPIPGPSYELQTNGYENLIFAYDAKYQACVARFPIEQWTANDFTLARQILCQSLAIPILFSVESPEIAVLPPVQDVSGDDADAPEATQPLSEEIADAGDADHQPVKRGRGRPPKSPATE